MKRMVGLMMMVSLAMPAMAQQTEGTAPPAPAPATPAPALPRVALDTSAGRIVIEADTQHAPITAGNFLKYVAGKRLDGTVFYRTVKVADRFGFVQFGSDGDPKRTLPPIAHEPTTKTGLTHDDGAISLARAAPGSGRGDFFIVVGSVPTLDADPAASGDKLGYAAFGHVTAGMDIVRRILRAPTAAGGPPGMTGQMLSAPVKIVSVRRVVAR